MLTPHEFFSNLWLWAGAVPWFIAQAVKPLIEYALKRRWDWRLCISSGGMPSSHTALVAGLTTAIALTEGMNSPVFAVAFVMSSIVIYDATGVRRHAGDQARVLNLMIDELFTGHPLAEKELKEMLGHTPRQVLGGLVLGVAGGWAVMTFFR